MRKANRVAGPSTREAIEVSAFTWSQIQRLYDPDATAHWPTDAKSWIVLLVAVSCDLPGGGGGAGLELLIGYTRLGNLLGLLDREDIPEIQKRLVPIAASPAGAFSRACANGKQLLNIGEQRFPI